MCIRDRLYIAKLLGNLYLYGVNNRVGLVFGSNRKLDVLREIDCSLTGKDCVSCKLYLCSGRSGKGRNQTIQLRVVRNSYTDCFAADSACYSCLLYTSYLLPFPPATDFRQQAILLHDPQYSFGIAENILAFQP